MSTAIKPCHDKSCQSRLKVLFWSMLVIAVLAFVRLTWVQLLDGEQLSYIAENRARALEILPGTRGQILTRQEIPLAVNLGDYTKLCVGKYRLIDTGRLATDLARITRKSKNYYQQLLSRDSKQLTLARQLTLDEFQLIRDLKWNFQDSPDSKRGYPFQELASHVVGFTDVDGHGLSGIELSCENILRGFDGSRSVDVDVLGHQLYRTKLPIDPAQPGSDVILTIDINLQSILQEELNRAFEQYQPESASGIILDPTTGEILAMSSLADYNPNCPNEAPVKNQRNRLVCDLVEIGSILKIVPLAMLLEQGLVDSTTLVDTNPGSIKVHGKTIHDVHNYGIINVKQVLVKSSNVGVIQLSDLFSDEELFDCIEKFGFISKTGIEIPGEATGLIPVIKRWSGTTKPNLVIGHGLAVTMLSVACAYQAIANHGVALKPTVMRGLRRPDGSVQLNQPVVRDTVISIQTAHTLTDFLIEAVTSGTGKQAAVKGLEIAGKTATASKPDLKYGGYLDDRYLSSFCGFFPARSPRMVMLITIDDPQGDKYYGGQVAAPVFQRITRRVLQLYPEIQRMVEDQNPTRELVVLPDFRNSHKYDAIGELSLSGLKPVCIGTGSIVIDQVPAAGSELTPATQVTLVVGERNQGDQEIVVPMFEKMAIRDAIKKATSVGLVVNVKGSGTVHKQSLPPGSKTRSGSLCILNAKG